MEEWDASIALMEKLLPTYFDGFFANISRGTCSASSAVRRCPRFLFACLLLMRGVEAERGGKQGWWAAALASRRVPLASHKGRCPSALSPRAA